MSGAISIAANVVSDYLKDLQTDGYVPTWSGKHVTEKIVPTGYFVVLVELDVPRIVDPQAMCHSRSEKGMSSTILLHKMNVRR